MSILIKPIITEKATADAELNNRYGFVVRPKANKVEIKKAVEATYGVSVEKGKTNAYKKAIVQVAEGDTIDFYNNI